MTFARKRWQIAVGLFLAYALLLTGCRSGRTITIERTPATSVTTAVDSAQVRAPRLRPLPRADMRVSFPEAVRRYRDRARPAAGTRRIEVVEVELTGESVTLRTEVGETVHRLPPAGETKTIRNVQSDTTRADSLVEYVEGAPDPERTEVTLPEERSWWDDLNKTIVLVIVLVALTITGLVALGRVLGG